MNVHVVVPRRPLKLRRYVAASPTSGVSTTTFAFRKSVILADVWYQRPSFAAFPCCCCGRAD